MPGNAEDRRKRMQPGLSPLPLSNAQNGSMVDCGTGTSQSRMENAGMTPAPHG